MPFRRPIYRPVSLEPYDPSVPQKPAIAVTCPQCEGACGYYVQLPGRPDTKHLVECEVCKGHGEVVE